MSTASLPDSSLDFPSQPVSQAPPTSTTLKVPSRPLTCVCLPCGTWPVRHKTRPICSPKRRPTLASTMVKTAPDYRGTSSTMPSSTTATTTIVPAMWTTKNYRKTLSVKYLKPSSSPTRTSKPVHRPISQCSTWPTIPRSVALTTTTSNRQLIPLVSTKTVH